MTLSPTGRTVSEPQFQRVRASGGKTALMRGKRAHLIISDELEKRQPVYPQPNWDKLDYYIEALRRFADDELASNKRVWTNRRDALEGSRSVHRWVWLRWVEQQASSPKGRSGARNWWPWRSP